VTVIAILQIDNPPKKLQGMTNNIGDAMLLFPISIEQDN
jgi:hypothetical protein